MTKEKALSIANEIDCAITRTTAVELVKDIYSEDVDNNIEQLIENQEKTIMWLCGYVMELHEFRDGIFNVNKESKNLDEVMDYVISKFPQLQGTANQRVFEELGKKVDMLTSGKDVNDTIDILKKKYLY